MADVLIALAVIAALTAAAVATGLAVLVRSLVRANRVTRGRRSSAPILWSWSWRLPARLHRRLRRAAQVAELAVLSLAPGAGDRRSRRGRRAPAVTPLHDVAAELVARAVTIDDWVVSASRLHPYRARPALARLMAEVSDVESSAYRLQRVCAEWRISLDRAAGTVPLASPELHERLDAVEAALAELSPRV